MSNPLPASVVKLHNVRRDWRVAVSFMAEAAR
jgi:hypothetical protein